MCNATFEHKNPDEVMEYLDLVAENAQNYDTRATYDVNLVITWSRNPQSRLRSDPGKSKEV